MKLLRQGFMALGAGAIAVTLLAFAGPAFRGEAGAAMGLPVNPVQAEAGIELRGYQESERARGGAVRGSRQGDHVAALHELPPCDGAPDADGQDEAA